MQAHKLKTPKPILWLTTTPKHSNNSSSPPHKSIFKIPVYFIIFFTFLYIIYTPKYYFITNLSPNPTKIFASTDRNPKNTIDSYQKPENKTRQLDHIVFSTTIDQFNPKKTIDKDDSYQKRENKTPQLEHIVFDTSKDQSNSKKTIDDDNNYQKQENKTLQLSHIISGTSKDQSNPQKPIDCDDSYQKQEQKQENKTLQLSHIIFGIASSSELWSHRQNYIKLWWKKETMRGFVWLDKRPIITNQTTDNNLPPVKISGDTSGFEYSHPAGDPSAVRLTRIAAETVRLGGVDVRWIVVGDDDTFFVPDNLVRVLSKYDHNKFYYIGGSSETHVQNIHFSYNMGFGGGGVALSYPLAAALEKMQDKCIQRYPTLYGSDDRIQACMAELGVPLTKEIGFHQLDIYGHPFGLLSAHPIAPLVSLHHLDVIEPIFPKMGRAQALEHLKQAIELDSAGLMQQSICYDKARKWTVSVSWGYAAQIYRGLFPAREIEKPIRSFVDWYQRDHEYGFTFNTRALERRVCRRPIVYVMSDAVYDPATNRTVSEYAIVSSPRRKKCWRRRRVDPLVIRRVEVFKKPDPYMWDKPPRRNCCRVLPIEKKGTISIDVGECKEGEIIGF